MLATMTDSADTADDLLARIFFDPAGMANPYPLYRQLRELAPVHQSATGAVVLTRFEDCREALRDNRLGKSNGVNVDGLIPSTDPEVTKFRAAQAQRILEADLPQAMLSLNPPDHTRQRSLVSRAFTPRRVEQLRDSIAGLARRAVDDVADAGSCDLLEMLAFPLPVAVIGTMVGVPEADWPRFRSQVAASAYRVEPGASLEQLQTADSAVREVGAYFHDLIAQRRSKPQDDLLSDLIAVEEAGDSLSAGEVAAVALLLFAAGFETTTNLIGNGMVALLHNPEQMQRLWDDPSLLPAAVEEMLRWDSPVQIDVRTALEPAEIAGVDIAQGRRLITLLGAANRDPAQFTNPEDFDIERDEGPPMSFASGIHYCLGANLARAEGQEVFGALIDRFSSIELDSDPVHRQRTTLRGYETVPVRVKAR